MRKIKQCPSMIETKSVETSIDLHIWLAEQAVTLTKGADKLGCWLLAHCHDGVIWGEMRDGKLALSCQAFPERGLALRWKTLQQARLFCEQAELLIWQGPQGWQATIRRDNEGSVVEVIDETHLLWGYRRDDETLMRHDGFVQIFEGAQGITHTPPIGDTTPTDQNRTSLRLRHYLEEDGVGMVRLVASRLVALVLPK